MNDSLTAIIASLEPTEQRLWQAYRTIAVIRSALVNSIDADATTRAGEARNAELERFISLIDEENAR